jgi:hypothetical protein
MIRFVQIVQRFNARVTALRMIQRSAHPMFPKLNLLVSSILWPVYPAWFNKRWKLSSTASF